MMPRMDGPTTLNASAAEPADRRHSRGVHDRAGANARSRAIHRARRPGRDRQAVRSDDPPWRSLAGAAPDLIMRARGDPACSKRSGNGMALARRARPSGTLHRREGLSAPALSQNLAIPRLDGFNVIASPGHPFGGASARRALGNARRSAQPRSQWCRFCGRPVRRAPISSAVQTCPTTSCAPHSQGPYARLAVLVKPHVWVPQSWAGAVAMSRS